MPPAGETQTHRRRKRASQRGFLANPAHPFVWYRFFAILFVLVSLGVLFFFSNGPLRLREAQYPLAYTEQISQASKAYEVNPYWICAVIKAESNWNSDAQSSADAVGLMQVLPETAQQLADWGEVDASVYPPDQLSDPAVNIEYGTAYLRYLVEHYHEMEPAIAAYNAGMGNVDEWMADGGDIRDNIRFPETRAYLLNIVRYKQQYEEIYPNAFSS